MHLPVLQKEVLQYLSPGPDDNFIDCTLGSGGDTFALLERNKPHGQVLAIDLSPEQIENTQDQVLSSEFEKRLLLVCDNFVNLKKIVQKHNFQLVNGILFDLGLSTWHLEESGRGFSFQKDEPLLMNYELGTKNYELTAAEIVNNWPEKEIERALREYGEERFSERIAKEIVGQRKKQPVKTTFQLVEIIKKATPRWYHYRKIPRSRTRFTRSLRGRHPATKTFQALRIIVNDELNNLKKALPQAVEVLQPGGRLVVISFHGLEDKIVKNFFKEGWQKELLRVLTKKPIRPSPAEIAINPGARSAKLRAAVKL